MQARVAFLLAATAAEFLRPLASGAQEWHGTTEVGRIRSSLDPSAVATPTVALGLQFIDAATVLRISGGLPTRSDEPLWGGVDASKQLVRRARAFLAGVDVMANAFALVDRSPTASPVPGPFAPPVTPNADRNGHALAGQLLPMVGYDGVRMQARVRAGASQYASRIGGESRKRTVTIADAQLTWLPAATFAVSPTVQQYRAAGEATVMFFGTSLITASSSGSLWATAGTWSAGNVSDLQWATGARLRLHPNISLEGSARHNAFDPLYLQPAQTSWSVGVSVLLGRARIVAPPVPAAYRDGKALIRLPVSASKTAPSIAGDFNAWTPAPMQRDGDNWSYTITLKPGVYHYSFVSHSGEWFVPVSVAGRKDDGMGGHVAVLVVR